MQQVLLGIDKLSTLVGKAFAWLIVVMTAWITIEVIARKFGSPDFVARHVLHVPYDLAYDFSYMLYGTLFMTAGAYTLSRNAHVRGDFIYRKWPPKRQAMMDLALYILFFFPGILALVYAGWNFVSYSYSTGERSPFSPDGPYLWPFKAVIPFVGILLLLQGIVEVARCIICIRTGEWPHRLHDVEEMEKVILEQAEHTQADEQELSR